MELLYLCLFLLQISFSLSSLNPFNRVDTNIKTIKVSKDFIPCLRNSSIPDEFLKQIESMNTIPMTIIDFLSHSFDPKEIINIRAPINNCIKHIKEKHLKKKHLKKKYQTENDSSKCSPSILTNCLLPYIDFENDNNDLINSKEGSQDWEDIINNVLSQYNKTEMYKCVEKSGCEQFRNFV